MTRISAHAAVRSELGGSVHVATAEARHIRPTNESVLSQTRPRTVRAP